MAALKSQPRRKSPRLLALAAAAEATTSHPEAFDEDSSTKTTTITKNLDKNDDKANQKRPAKVRNGRRKKQRSATSSSTPKTKASVKPESDNNVSTTIVCLPRTIEHARQAQFPYIQKVLGIDEAGRGPLAGPVVVAAAWVPTDIQGIVDSKKITKEEERERLFELLIQIPDIQWAIAVVDAKRIDEINILQATLEGMRLVATALVEPSNLTVPVHSEASVQHDGCYIVRSTNEKNMETTKILGTIISYPRKDEECPFYALIDGNKVPKDMPCPAESVVKGDGKEFAIAAASILAKVTRDRLMHGYHLKYPEFQLAQHKGYPTAAHMKAVMTHGASPIHRRTFAPLKHMVFDDDGKVANKQ